MDKEIHGKDDPALDTKQAGRNRFLGTFLVTFCLIFFLLALADTGYAQSGDEDDPLADPVALGAWLYQGNCVRCHGLYEKSRVANGLSADEVRESITGSGQSGCAVSWGRSRGGPFSSSEIDAVIAYMLTWDDLGGEPPLPELPPQPTPTIEPTTAVEGVLEDTPTPPPELEPQLKVAVEGSTLAKGAYLYTQNCYRCHLAYENSRTGNSLTEKYIRKLIQNGKTATSMSAFSVKRGGILKASEINAIVYYIVAFESLNEQPALPDILFVPPTPDPAKLQVITLPDIPWVEGDLENGENLYAIHCQDCHGSEGEGGAGPALTKRDWNSLRPDLTIFSTIRTGVVGSSMPAWGQMYEGPLSDSQIRDLTILLLDWREDALSDKDAVVRYRIPEVYPLAILGGFALVAVLLFGWQSKIR